ncbi:MAG: 16S rRNA (cytidine(1402)-2'-O)-methyltransferase [Alphaproteobacteria bacterium]|nr:16S rRNA (cytidine(1402)-2'-O)-methyltransferase [Alphaproteobacteria bacterium]
MTGKKQKTSFDYSAWARRSLEASGETETSKLPAGLYVVSTPIGNLGDITLRALRTLMAADAVACEDTRVTGGLLHRFGIKKPLVSYHDHNADERRPALLARIASGEAVALVSDAGTPLVSDPGCKLVQACRAEGFSVTAIPGASALLAALSSAGLPTDKFMFAGFLPPKKTARQKALTEMAAVSATLVFYEAPSRLSSSLDDMEKVLGGNREAAVCRELTKLFEEVRTSSLSELAVHYRDAPVPKGEIVILIGPPVKAASMAAAASSETLDAELKKALRAMSLRDAVAHVASTTGIKKSEVYNRALKLQKKRSTTSI